MRNDNHPVDSKGTSQKQAVRILQVLSDQGFASDIEKLALALGRDVDEIENMLGGEKLIDDDLAMKMRELARQRNIEIE